MCISGVAWVGMHAMHGTAWAVSRAREVAYLRLRTAALEVAYLSLHGATAT